MAYGKSIELFLANGTADSLIIAELSNWNGKAIKIPRIEVSTCSRDDFAQANRLLLHNMCFLLGTGFIIISRLSFAKAVRQVVIAGVGFLIALIIPVIIEKIKLLRKGWLVYGFLGIGLLAAVYILGEITNGSKISFSIYGV